MKFMVERGLYQNGFLIYFGEFKCLDYLLDSMLFFGPSFSHLICYFNYFLQIQWYFSKLKKGSLVHVVWVKYIWDNSCF